MDEIQEILKKTPGKTYYRIGEVARITKVKPYVLRFWESEFKMMVPPKSRSKQRMYRRKDIETILQIKWLLYKERFTIEGARKRLATLNRQERDEPEPLASPKSKTGLAKIRTELQEISDLLAEA